MHPRSCRCLLAALLAAAACSDRAATAHAPDAATAPSSAPAPAPSSAPASAPSSAPASAPSSAPASAVDDVLTTRSRPIPRSTKIFLFAGSSRNANFAQEVIDQRALWHGAGYGDDDIACYYVVPYQEEFDGDRDQWLALAPTLASCYPASVALLFEHLRATAGGPFLYLYLTAHGEQPISRALAAGSPGDDGYYTLARRARYAVLDQHRVVVESLPDGTANDSEIVGALRAGADPRTLYLTPAHLAEALRPYGQIAKYIAIQACFSGGFIHDPRLPDDAQPLPALPNVTILTATRHDRKSFGCDAGERTTYYGGAYLEALRERVADPRVIDWAALHRATSARVQALERAGDERPSHPSFFSTGAGRAASRRR